MTFYYNKKIFFLGGLQTFPGDNSSGLIYSFCTINHEWVIESNRDTQDSNQFSQYIVI
jgi:hypothetical protein